PHTCERSRGQDQRFGRRTNCARRTLFIARTPFGSSSVCKDVSRTNRIFPMISRQDYSFREVGTKQKTTALPEGVGGQPQVRKGRKCERGFSRHYGVGRSGCPIRAPCSPERTRQET